jgi:hypothetical protein
VGRSGYVRWTVQEVEFLASEKSLFRLVIATIGFPPVEDVLLDLYGFVLPAYLPNTPVGQFGSLQLGGLA